MEKKIRVLLADDHAMVRDGLGRILEETDDISVVGQADNGLTAVSLAQQIEPDVVVLDYGMPRLDGLGATERIRKHLPKTKVLMLTAYDNVQFAVRSLEAGAHGFLLKEEAADELIAAIRSVNAGNVAVSRKIMENLAACVGRGEKVEVGLDSLSSQEFELVRHLGSGKSIHETAAHMHISQSTASTYRSRLLKKLGLKTTEELIRFLLEKGLVGALYA